MNAALPPTLTTHLVSVIADADPGLLARMSGVLARLDILPLQIYSRLRQDIESRNETDADIPAHLEIDLYLSADSAGRKDRLVGLLRTMVGVESVAVSN